MTLQLPITLRFSSEPVRPAVAWLIAEGDVSAALRAWESWNLSMHEWRVLSLGSLGLLTILAEGQSLLAPANALPMGRFGRVLLPTHGELSCVISEAELAELLPKEAAFVVFLPGESPVVIEESQLRTVADFLSPPPRRGTDWSAAQPGPHLNERLISVRPAIPPTIEMILQAGRDDIASRGDLGDLPPRQGEPGDSLFDSMRRSVQQGIGGFIQWLAGAPSDANQPHSSNPPANAGSSGGASPASAPSATWLESLVQWSQGLLGSVSKETEDLRHREILRLMEMLKNNPEEGLKYAIPFGGGQGRGIAPPGGHLVRRPVDFNLRNLGGGGPIDYWNLPENYYHDLAKQYRALANRELQLGRYRRAAYIFAELLHEFHAAASALETGGHWREAATLYQSKLHQPLAAAQCLERGGLLDEAIEIYAPLGFEEKVGDLYARLERFDEAQEAWCRAISTHVVQHRDYLKAAAIAKDKLRDDDRTLEILDQGWSDWNQPGQCLAQAFALLGERGRHDEAQMRLRQLQESTPRLDRDLLAAETLAQLLASYPDRSVMEKGRDVVKALAGARLRSEVPERQRRWIRAVEATTPEDRLVPSDGRRFVEGLLAGALKPKPRPATKGKEPRLETTFRLTEGVPWKTVVAKGDRFFAAGISGGMVRLVRGDWQGHLQTAMTVGQKGQIPDDCDLAMLVHELPSIPLKLAPCGRQGEGQYYFGVDEHLGVSQHAWLRSGRVSEGAGAQTMGLCYALGTQFELVLSGAQLLLQGSTSDSGDQTSLHYTLPFGLDEFDHPMLMFPMQGTSEFFVAGVYNLLHCRSRKRGPYDRILNDNIESLAISAPFTPLRVAAGFAQGGVFLPAIKGHDLDEPIRFGDDLISPHVCFTASGLLVAIGENGGEIFATGDGKLTAHQKLRRQGFAPLAVVPVEGGDRFAVFNRNGEVEIYDAG